MSFQRRLAIVPGSDMLSPIQAQRILAEHQSSDYPRSPNHHQGPGFGPSRLPSPPDSAKLRIQIPKQNHNDVRLDEPKSDAVQRWKFKLKNRSTNLFRDVHRRRRAWGSGRQNPISDRHAHRKRQPMKDSREHQGKFSSTHLENISSMSGNVSGAMRHSKGETSCPSEARNSFTEPPSAPSIPGRHSSTCPISPRDTSALDSAPFARG